MKVVELAIKAARKRQSEITRFVHHCYEHPEKSRETIPTYENFCFALALLRSKTAENILEAKTLLEKLLKFQVEGHFPIYLHEYPTCRYLGLNDKLYPVIFFIMRDFHTVLGEALRKELTKWLQPPSISFDTASPEGLAEWLIHAQLTDQDVAAALEKWDSRSLVFVGAQRQEQGEPAVTLLDLFLGEWSGRFSKRALADHPVHLRAGLIYPRQVELKIPVHSIEHTFWGDGDPTHSLVLETAGKVENNSVHLPEKEVLDEVEVAYFCNIHPSTEIWIEGKRGTTFQLGQSIQLISQEKRIELVFNIEGDGQFWGHIYRGNRKGQLSCWGEAKHEAYDWVIALRTVKRSLSSTIHISYR